jgi:signal transduction histidine kinase
MAQIGATVCEAVHGADLAEASAMARAIRAVFDRYLAGSSDMADEKRASAELAETREAERLRLAHGLYDTVVQQRLGLSYQLAAQGGRAAANEMAEFLNEEQRVAAPE